MSFFLKKLEHHPFKKKINDIRAGVCFSMNYFHLVFDLTTLKKHLRNLIKLIYRIN
jgi:hypothetical protein